MTFRRWLLAAVVGLALFAGLIVKARSRDGTESGIHGRVLAGCLDEQGDDPKPVVGIQQVLRWPERGSPQFVRRFRSDSDGRFSIPLPPGLYQIVPDPDSLANGNMKPVDVTVRSGENVEVDPFYDCGMR